MKKVFAFLILLIPIAMIFIVNFSVNILSNAVDISVQSVALNQDVLVVNLKDSVKLEATIYPSSATNKELVWSSSNEEVATVDDNGKVSLVGFGGCYITVKSLESAKQCSCYLYVTDTEINQIVAYTDTEDSSILIGGSIQIKTKVIPAEAVLVPLSFEVVNGAEFASVDEDGNVVGIKAGTATIKVFNEEKQLEAFISIRVKKPVEGLVLNEQEVVYSNSNYYYVSYNVLPEDATNKNIKITLSNNDIATAVGSCVNFKSAGEEIVTVTTLDGQFSKSFKLIFTDGYADSISITEEALNLKYVDKNYQLNYSTNPTELYNTSVTFSSLDESVATVDSFGYITINGGGFTTIVASAKKCDGSIVKSSVSLYVERDAEDILVESENIVSASKTYQLNIQSLPKDSTNTNFYYSIIENETLAQISNNGYIQFSESGTIKVRIYANKENSEVFKDVYVTCTNGLATDFVLTSQNVTLTYNQVLTDIIANYVPSTGVVENYELSIVSQNAKYEGEEVIQIVNSKSLKTIGSGSATIKVSMLGFNGVIEKQFNVTVVKNAEEVKINLSLDKYNDSYVTGKDVVEFSGTVLPSNITNSNISWSVSNPSVAYINANKLYFISEGSVELIATCGNIEKRETIVYVGSTPLSVTFNQFNTNLKVSLTENETAVVQINGVIPSDISTKDITLYATNQNSKVNGNVIKINGNKIIAQNGGTATVQVAVNGYVYETFEIVVTRQAQDFEVNYQDVQTTKSKLSLTVSAIPLDATIDNISYQIIENVDIATITDNVVKFVKYGTIKIKATTSCGLEKEFYIERINNSGLIEGNELSYELGVGESFTINVDELQSDYFRYEILTVEGQENISLYENVVNALLTGTSKLIINYYDSDQDLIVNYVVNITIIQNVEDILLSNFDYYQSMYVTAQQENDLLFEVLPENATNKQLEITSSDRKVADIVNGKLVFNMIGNVELVVASKDQSVQKKFIVKYTGGTAIDAELNIASEINLKESEIINIEVVKWIPSNAIYKTISITENSRSEANEVILLEEQKVTAVANGTSNLSVKLSNQSITKTIKVVVSRSVSQISFEQNQVLTSKNSYQLKVNVYPTNAQNKNIDYFVNDESIATVIDGTLHFVKEGTVVVTAKSSENNLITDQLTITSTLGKVSQIILDKQEISINKGNSYQIKVNKVLPEDLEYEGLDYSVISSTPNLSGTEVITLENGIVSAISGGTSVIRIKLSGLNQEVYADLTINVKVIAESLSFDLTDLEFYNSAVVVGCSELQLKVNMLPIDCSKDSATYTSSNTNIALINETGLISFLSSGYVSITVSSGNVSISQLFYYTNNKALSASIDTSKFKLENEIYNYTMHVGENVDIKLNSIMPKNISSVNITSLTIQKNAVLSNKEVVEIRDGKIYAVSGGNQTIQILVNGYLTITLKVNVIQQAQSIYLEQNEMYVSSPTVQLKPVIYPLDSTFTTLTYQSNNTSIAQVDENGFVQFSKLGTVVITIKQPDCSVVKNINITYTKQVQNISTNSIPDVLFNNQTIKISVISYPANADSFNVIYHSSNTNLVTISNDGILSVKPKITGYVTITLKVEGKEDISYSKEVFVYYNITNIALKEDASNDNLGIAGKRVWGNRFYEPSFDMTNVYQMQILSIYPKIDDIQLKWTSSDPEIAEVDNNGLIRFSYDKVGKVTITVSPIYSNNGTKDSYTFEVVKGVNIYTWDQFCKVKSIKQKNAVLQSNLVATDKDFNNYFLEGFQLYGNGYSIDYSNIEVTRMYINVSNVLIENVTLTGTVFKEGGKLTDLEKKKVLVCIDGKLNPIKNIYLRNTIFENACALVEVQRAEVFIEGCIFKNSYSSAVSLMDLKDSTEQATVHVKDCVFGDSLAPSIAFGISENKGKSNPSKLYIEGQLYMYNWRKLNEVGGDFIKTYIDDAESALENAYKNYPSLKYVYNGQNYYMFGIAQYSAKYTDAFKYETNASVDMNGISTITNQYIYVDIVTTARIKFAGITVPADIPVEVKMYTLNNENTLTSPGTKWDSTIYNKIRQA